MLKCVLDGGIDWIGLAQDRNKWTVIMNSVFKKVLRISQVAAQLVNFLVVLSSIELVIYLCYLIIPVCFNGVVFMQEVNFTIVPICLLQI
jgi:hypothetical protein